MFHPRCLGIAALAVVLALGGTARVCQAQCAGPCRGIPLQPLPQRWLYPLSLGGQFLPVQPVPYRVSPTFPVQPVPHTFQPPLPVTPSPAQGIRIVERDPDPLPLTPPPP